MTQKFCEACGTSDLGDRFCERCDQFLSMPPGVKKASIPRRLGAFIVDGVLAGVPAAEIGLTVLLRAEFALGFTDLGSWFYVLLLFAGLFGGYFIWFLITLQWGQTPGKQLFRLAAFDQDSRRLGWRRAFVREALVKGVLIGGAGLIIFSIGFVIDAVAAWLSIGIVILVYSAWTFRDQDRQALHDKIVRSVVVDIRRSRA